MRTRTFSSLVLAAALAIPSIASAQIHVGGSVNVKVGANAHVGPHDPPPAPKEEKWQPRRGQVWVAGHYDWKGGQWVWVAGKFQGRKKNRRFVQGRWDKQGDSYAWVDGSWADAPKEPDAPPAIIVESEQSRPGMVWVAGYWQWADGSYDWVPGHLAAKKRGKAYVAGHWDNAGGRWTWTAESWVDGPKEPTAPPPPRAETPKMKRGQVWVAGNWKWDDGQYVWVAGHLESRKRMKRYTQGRWDNVGGKYTWVAGSWIDAPKEPDAGPPAPPAEDQGKPRKGSVWVKGQYEWKDGDYEWTPGHWEKERTGKVWQESRWENVGGKWTFRAGAWN